MLLLCALPLSAAPKAHTRANLILANEVVRPGETIWAGIHLRMEKNWHTYWRNPGGSGMSTSVDWELPQGIKAGAIQWPLPEKLSDQGLTSYIYENETVLLVPLTVSSEVKPGRNRAESKSVVD